MSITFKELETHADARGFVFEPLEAAHIMRQHNAHVVVSNPGAIRGNHFHRRGTETIIVMGPALVRLKEGGKVKDLNIPGRKVYRVTVPPGVAHAFQNTGTDPNVLVAFNTAEHSPHDVDVTEEILIPDK